MSHSLRYIAMWSADHEKQAMDVLTADQKALLTKMKGAKVSYAKSKPPRS